MKVDTRNSVTDVRASEPMATAPVDRRPLVFALLLVQSLVSILLFWPFLTGERYLAFIDIGADSYALYTYVSQNMARIFAQEGWSGWSFNIGLGAPLAINFSDIFRWLTQLRGADHVLELRIWVYLLKIALGGLFFLLLALDLARRKETAVIAAVSYSYCGYMMTTGMWDSESNAFVFLPLVVWSILRFLRTGRLLMVVVSVAATLLSGVFFLAFAVSLGMLFLACLLFTDDARRMTKLWLVRLTPAIALGFLISAPVVLPIELAHLDSPRITGSASLLPKMLSEALSVSDPGMVALQAAALFHKNYLGAGDYYTGYINYLEGPDFYVGVLWLLLLPQLWRGNALDRRALVVGVAAVVVYMTVPLFRLSAYALLVPYFRITSLWVGLVVLVLGMRALDRVLDRPDLRMLVVGVVGVEGLLALTYWGLNGDVWSTHLVLVALTVAIWTAVLALAAVRPMRPGALATAVLALTAVECVAFSWSSFQGSRVAVTPTGQLARDVTLDAVAAIRERDSGFWRAEKTYQSFVQSEAMAQDFMGVKSYYYHGAATVEFHNTMRLVRDWGPGRPTNYTNWLEGPKDRFILHSVLGVKYLIGHPEKVMTGFERIARSPETFWNLRRGRLPRWQVYENEYAYPLGVVYTQQVTRAEFDRLRKLPTDDQERLSDLTLANAAVVDRALPQLEHWDLRARVARDLRDLEADFMRPAREMQRTGLQITKFSHKHITGRIQPDRAGLLVFSIPAYKGWTLWIDGRKVPLQVANFGFLAAPVEAGAHDVELRFALPGLLPGFLLGGLGLLLLGGWWWKLRRAGAGDAVRSAPGQQALER